MKIEITTNGNQLIASFAGRLDTAAAVQTAEDVKPLMEAEGKEIILDCTALEYISSSGLRIFLGIRKEAAAHGSKVGISEQKAPVEADAFCVYPSLFSNQLRILKDM